MLYKQRVWIIGVFYVALFSLSFLLAWALQFDFSLPSVALLSSLLPVLVLFRLAALRRYGLLHVYWTHNGLAEMLDIFKAVALGSLAFFVVAHLVLGNYDLPASVYVIEALTSMGMLAGIRVTAILISRQAAIRGPKKRRVLVVGAGSAAALLIREMSPTDMLPVACVDDDRFKRGARIHGVAVLGNVDDLPAIAEAESAQEIFIAIPSATGSQMRRITAACGKAGLPCRTMPSVRDLLAGRELVSQLREIDVEDLLGRDPITLDLTAVRQRIAGKVVMVTGAAGSIGSELCRQLIRQEPAKLIALDQAETALFYLQLQLTKETSGDRVSYVVEDVANTERLSQILQEEKVDVIFHAAAYKHVPMVETNVRAALENNVFALRRLLNAAEEAGCDSFVLISTDKAVHPTSFMGATKRIGELMLAARTGQRMRSVAVRFGNVLGSQGSVIPVFKEQIQTEGRITITHPEITRYFMTIPEAVSLVLQGFTIGNAGDILVLDMGSPIRIMDLAHSLIRLCGKTSSEVRIEITGLRKGEKLHEELFYQRERQLPTTHRKVKRTQSDTIDWPALTAALDELQVSSKFEDEGSVRRKVNSIVPEYIHAPVPDDAEEPSRPAAPAPVYVPPLAQAATATGTPS
jgi:FlaA1/EpsC-like NDP-sugar epimerase